ncbi:unnamed protein product [Porites lobata]|uniref:RING-type domain-containing protein n=1 Tax=Porites lobata TaxID=104759 RepID=A0ABN8N2A5_9CNID|nr:unnamed protein product [Porites lobata]
MDIKTLLDNLHDEVSCSVCMCTFTDPKQLPCLHSFCLHCLNGIQRTSGIHGKITCPECRRQFQISGSGNPSELPTNFRINSLLDVLAIKECSTVNVKCRNCEKRSSQTSYCFQCCSFWCEECIVGHNIMRENKDHRTLALKDFQDQDIKAVLERPAFCQKKHHENKELELFCKDSQQSGTKGKESSKVIAGNKGANVRDSPLETQVQTRRFRSVLSFGQKGEFVGMLNGPWGMAVNDRDEIAVTGALNNSVSVFSSDGTHLRSFGRFGKNNGEFKFPAGIAFDSHGNIVVADSSNHRVQVFDRNGNFLSMFGERGSRDNQLKYPLGLSINNNGDIIVADRDNKLIKIFSSTGKYLRKFGGAGSLVSFSHCIQHGQYFIVSDYGDHSIKLFNLEGKFISKFGKQGIKDGEFNEPGCLSVNKEGLLMVCDRGNHRVQVFELSGKFVTKFGSEGSERGEFKLPVSTANLSDGKIVVCDFNNSLIQINSVIRSLKDKVRVKQNEVEQFNQRSIAFQWKVTEVKSQVQSCVDQIIAIVEARKQDVFDAVDNQAKKLLESLSQKKEEVEKQLKIIESAVEQTETLLKRSFSTEILGFSETFDTILQEQGTQENRDTECIPRFSFTKSEKLINLLSMSEGIGNVEFVFSETKAQQSGAKGKESSKAIAGNKGANVRDSPLETQVQTRRFRSVLSFGQKGAAVGMFNAPYGVAVNDHDEIAVTDTWNHRVSVFSSDRTHLRSFGRKGQNNGELHCPKGIAFDSHGNIVVADSFNHRVQVFDTNGNFLSKFGEQGSGDNQLQYPEGLSINGNGDIIVADTDNKLIKIFSSSGEYLRKFGGAGSPYCCIQYGQHFIVSDAGDHSIKMFNLEGKFISKFGKQGNKYGEFNKPRYLSVNKEGLLMVCDAENHRVQVFELSGKFVTKFGSEGSERGEFRFPRSLANLSDGRIVVCEMNNNRIQVFDKI